jgi:hypothetical protein
MVEKAGAFVQVMWSPLAPKVGEVVTFTDVVGNITKIGFGDGRFWAKTEPEDKFPVKHTYIKEGAFIITSIGRDASGNIGTDDAKIIVKPSQEPEPDQPDPEPEPEPNFLARLIAAFFNFLKSFFGK